MRRISDSSALLFIALWNFSDDHGFFVCDTLELSLKVPRWRPQSLFKMLCSLADHGLIKLCSQLGVGQIVSWEHQKIKDRRASKWNDIEIKWDEISVDAQGSDRIRPGEDRIGKDRIGKERIGSGVAPNVRNPRKKPEPSPINSEIWEAYRDEYEKRYRVEPVRNQKVNGQISQLAKRLGAEAVEVVRFYVQHPKTFYVSKLHEFGLCLADAESLRTQWAKGKAITGQDLKKYDAAQSVRSTLDAINRGEI